MAIYEISGDRRAALSGYARRSIAACAAAQRCGSHPVDPAVDPLHREFQRLNNEAGVNSDLCTSRKCRRPRWIREAITLHFRRCRVKIKTTTQTLKWVKKQDSADCSARDRRRGWGRSVQNTENAYKRNAKINMKYIESDICHFFCRLFHDIKLLYL